MKRIRVILLVCLLTMNLIGCDEKTTNIIIDNNIDSVIDDNNIENDVIHNDVPIETPTPEPTPIERDDVISISMVGDNLIHSSIYKNAKQNDGTYNFASLFENMKKDISSADISIINQETIFVTDYSLIDTYPCFGTPAEMGKYIVEAGFDIVSCATNHTYDKKEKGIRQTLEYWNTNYPNMTYLGIYNNEKEYNTIKTYECKGVTFSFVNYTYGLNGFVVPDDKKYLVNVLNDMDKFDEDVKKANEIGDIVICILHIGNEYVYEPTNYQKEVVNRAIDNGADIVFCSHPHVLEPYEMVTTEKGNCALVYYSLGNYISSQDKIPRLLGGIANVKLNIHYIDDVVTNIEIGEYDLTPIVTHYDTKGYFTTYRLDEYTNELANAHRIKNKDSRFSIEYLHSLYKDILGLVE